MNGSSASITFQNNRLMVSGDLGFQTVMHVWAQSLPLLAQANTVSELQFDLSNVISSDSAGLALLLEWVKYAKRINRKISFQYLPAQLNSIIAVAGISDLISLS